MTTLTSNDGFVEHYDATKLRKSFVRSTSCINRIHHAREELLSGKPVLLVDDDGDEAAGHLVICAEQARVGAVSFLVRHSSGYLCVAMESERCRKLGLPPAWESDAPDRSRFDYRIAVDAATGIGNGVGGLVNGVGDGVGGVVGGLGNVVGGVGNVVGGVVGGVTAPIR